MVLNVSATVLPGITILLVNDWRDALALAKALVVGMMFLTGYLWGRITVRWMAERNGNAGVRSHHGRHRLIVRGLTHAV